MKRIVLFVIVLAASFAQAQVKFVSLDHGIYTFEQGDTVIRAKCLGWTTYETGFTPKICPLDYRPGQSIPEFNPDRSKKNWIEVNTNGVTYVTYSGYIGRDGEPKAVDVDFDIVSWKQK
jgi:hypothetical protein